MSGIINKLNEKFNLDKYLQNITTTPEYLFVDSNYNYLNMFLITAVPTNCCHCSVFYLL